ncbi:MAG: hypothetical protein RJB13_1291, partial [Pseudomonadota bacterium]
MAFPLSLLMIANNSALYAQTNNLSFNDNFSNNFSANSQGSNNFGNNGGLNNLNAPAPANNFGAAPANNFGAAPANNFGAAPANNFGAAPANNFGAAPANNFGAAPANNFGAAPASNFGAAPANSFGAAPANGGGAAQSNNNYDFPLNSETSAAGNVSNSSNDQGVYENSAESSPAAELIALEYRNAPLIEVIRTLADAANLNITLSADVEKGSPVSIRLNNVTYEQALKAILDTYKFGSIFENGILKVDTIANLSSLREERLKEKESEWKNQPTKRLVWQVNYAKAVDLVPILTTMLKAYSVDPRFSVIADKRTNKVIIEGISDALVESKAILDSLDRRKQQVLIEARIVEASSELSKTLSVTWGTRFGFEGNRGLANGLLFPNSLSGSVGGAGALGTSAPNPLAGKGATQLGTMAFSVGSINNLINIDAVLRAYETEALANVIASPRVVVQDQEKATIKEDISLSHSVLGATGQPEGRNTIATLELVVAPQVTSDNTLELDIQVQRQTPTNAPTDPVQGSIKRQANTKLIVSNGETAVIGGLYQTQKFKGQGRVPFLGRLPLIGALFRTNEEQSFRSELMVLITPRILPMTTGRGSARADLPVDGNFTNNSNNNSNNFNNNASNSNSSNGENVASSSENAGNNFNDVGSENQASDGQNSFQNAGTKNSSATNNNLNNLNAANNSGNFSNNSNSENSDSNADGNNSANGGNNTSNENSNSNYNNLNNLNNLNGGNSNSGNNTNNLNNL